MGRMLSGTFNALAIIVLVLFGFGSLLPGNGLSAEEIALYIGSGALAAILLWNIGYRLKHILGDKDSG